MIIFNGTKVVGVQSYLVFTNETGKTIEIPVDPKTYSIFIHYFDRLQPSITDVELPKHT